MQLFYGKLAGILALVTDRHWSAFTGHNRGLPGSSSRQLKMIASVRFYDSFLPPPILPPGITGVLGRHEPANYPKQ